MPPVSSLSLKAFYGGLVSEPQQVLTCLTFYGGRDKVFLSIENWQMQGGEVGSYPNVW